MAVKIIPQDAFVSLDGGCGGIGAGKVGNKLPEVAAVRLVPYLEDNNDRKFLAINYVHI